MVKAINEHRTKKNKPILSGVTNSSDSENILWSFAKIDRNGEFAFDPFRPDFDVEQFVCKLLAYSNMTWGEIKKQTHDNNKSKNHFLTSTSFSKEAKDRIKFMNLDEKDNDSIFSLALDNKTRLVGIRNGAVFKVIWYDSQHKFAPTQLKNT